MKLLYGTSNPSKIEHMREVLKGLELEIIGLNDIEINTIDIDESGNNPLQNARIKALAYYEALKIPVFSCDSGLFIKDLDENRQPGVHVRRVNGKSLNDEEMIIHYTNIASRFGGKVEAKYKNAICLVVDKDNIFEYNGEDISSLPFYLTSVAHPKRNAGFPLNSISLELKTEKYYMDLDSKSRPKDNMKYGFRNFFIRTVLR